MSTAATTPPAADWHRLPPMAKAKLRDRLAARVARDRARARAWLADRRVAQVPPVWAWFVWLVLAGRGWGKTRVGAETIADWMRDYPGARVALVAETFADGRDTMVEGESGLLAVLDPIELRGGSIEDAWNRSLGELFLANGSRARIFASERPGKLRGPQFHFAWGDELAKWRDAWRDAGEEGTTWSNLLFGLRLRAPRAHGGGGPCPIPGCGCAWPDYQPRIVVTTTPKPVALLRAGDDLVAREPHRAGLTQRESTHVTTGRTDENLSNLADAYRREVVDPVRGTRLARQELEAEILSDVVGAFLSSEMIVKHSVLVGDAPGYAAVVTAVDPATTDKRSSAETGIVTTAVDAAGHGFVLADRSGRYSPDEWGRAVWAEVARAGSQAVVVEDNAGGDMVEHVLATTWQTLTREAWRRSRALGPHVPIVRVHPSGAEQGKWARALPVSLLAEQGRLHFVTDPERPGWSTALEDQATAWTGRKEEVSPDRVDALVHGITWLLFPARRSEKKPGRKQPSRRADPSARWGGARGR